MLDQDEGDIGKAIPNAQEISRDPKDFPRAKPERNLEGRGNSRGCWESISQQVPTFPVIDTLVTGMGRDGFTVLKSILPC